MIPSVKYFAYYVEHICNVCKLLFIETVEPLTFCLLGYNDRQMTINHSHSNKYSFFFFFFPTFMLVLYFRLKVMIGNDK